MEKVPIVLIERCDFLDSNLLSRRLVQRRTDDTVCALANNILNVILLANVEGDLAGTALRRSARHLVGIATGLRCGCQSRQRRERETLSVEKKWRLCCAVAQQLGAGATGAEGAMEG
jgi:hypothetical protein